MSMPSAGMVGATAMSDLENDRFIFGGLLVGGSGSYHLTSHGLQEAERLAIERGTDVYEQAGAGLVRRLLPPSLIWFAGKVRDESASALIKKLIALVTAFRSGLV